MQDGLLSQIIGNHAGDEVVNALVICYAVAGGIDDGHVACHIGIHEVWYAYEGGGFEEQRVEIFIADPAVKGSHLSSATAGAAVEPAVFHEQVAALSQHSPRLFCQIGMLEVGGVVPAGGEDDIDASRVDMVHGVLQELAVVPVVQNPVLLEGGGAAAAAIRG